MTIYIWWLLMGSMVILLIVSLFITFRQMRPWKSPMQSREKWKRSTITGVAVISFAFAMLTILDLSTSTQAMMKWTFESTILSLCFILPFGFFAIVGSYIGYGLLDSLKQQGLKSIKREGKDKNDS
jgi:hypothetical protein